MNYQEFYNYTDIAQSEIESLKQLRGFMSVFVRDSKQE
jgi:hypothetical protein